MSVVLRSLLRDPLVTRPLSRALRRFDNDFWHDDYWPVMKRPRRAAEWESPLSLMEDMTRQMNAAMSRMQDDLENLDSLVGRHGLEEGSRRHREEAMLRRTEDGGLQLALDVADFKPEDLKIKLVDDHLMIEGVTETSGKDSYRQTQFKRWFKLPEDCKLEAIKSTLTEDNRLVIDLPTNKPLEQRARSIPIEMDRSKTQQTTDSQQQLNSSTSDSNASRETAAN